MIQTDIDSVSAKTPGGDKDKRRDSEICGPGPAAVCSSDSDFYVASFKAVRQIVTIFKAIYFSSQI